MGGSFLSKLLHPRDSDRKIIPKPQNKEVHHVLIMGTPKSGKSTLFKQLQLIYGNGFDEKFKYQKREDIRKHVTDIMVSILTALPSLSPPVMLGSLQNEAMAKLILDRSKRQDFKYFTEFDNLKNIPKLVSLSNFIKTLWQDAGVREAHLRGNEFNLADSAKYFFDRIDVIGDNDYLPTDEDILRCPFPGACNEEFYIDPTKLYISSYNRFVDNEFLQNFKFRIVDVANYDEAVNKWSSLLVQYASIIFVVDSSSYDIISEESLQNCLEECFEIYRYVFSKRRWSSFGVVLNKEDVFREKIFSSQLGNYFSDFRCSSYDAYPKMTKDFIMNILKDIYIHAYGFHIEPFVICAFNVDEVEHFFNYYSYIILLEHC